MCWTLSNVCVEHVGVDLVTADQLRGARRASALAVIGDVGAACLAAVVAAKHEKEIGIALEGIKDGGAFGGPSGRLGHVQKGVTHDDGSAVAVGLERGVGPGHDWGLRQSWGCRHDRRRS